VVAVVVGSPVWLDATGGILSRVQRVQLIGRTGREIPRVVTHRLGAEWWRRQPSRGACAFNWQEPPNSEIAELAAETCRANLSDAFVNHSFRAWAFGSALAERDGRLAELDGDVFFVAALLHDLGLFRSRYRCCFTRAGVDEVRNIAARTGRDLDDAAGAISHHITPGLRPKISTYARYLQRGSLLDLVGTRAIHLPKQFVLDVFDQYPSAGIRHEAGARWRAEAALVGGGRAHLVQRWGRISLMCRISPLPP
jgi:hypothetical protein